MKQFEEPLNAINPSSPIISFPRSKGLLPANPFIPTKCMQIWRSPWPWGGNGGLPFVGDLFMSITASQIGLYALSLRRTRMARGLGVVREVLRNLKLTIIIPPLTLIASPDQGPCCLPYTFILFLLLFSIILYLAAFHATPSPPCNPSLPPQLPPPPPQNVLHLLMSSADYDPSFSETLPTLNSDPAWPCLPVPDASCNTRRPCACVECPPRHIFPDLC